MLLSWVWVGRRQLWGLACALLAYKRAHTPRLQHNGWHCVHGAKLPPRNLPLCSTVCGPASGDVSFHPYTRQSHRRTAHFPADLFIWRRASCPEWRLWRRLFRTEIFRQTDSMFSFSEEPERGVRFEFEAGALRADIDSPTGFLTRAQSALRCRTQTNGRDARTSTALTLARRQPRSHRLRLCQHRRSRDWRLSPPLLTSS